MSEANNFHSIIYSGHYHRSLLVKKVASLQLVDKEGQEMLHLLTYMYKELLGKEKKIEYHWRSEKKPCKET